MISAMRASAFLSSALFTVCVQATQVEIAYTGDYFHNTQGGIRTGDTYLDLLELNLSQSFELTNDWALHANIGALHTNGNGLSENIVGDIQVASNLEGGGQFAKLATATLEFASTSGSVKLGLYDINSEFDVLESAELFINSAHGIGSEIALTGQNGPSIYPFYSLAIRGQWAWDERHLIRAAIMDGVPGAESSNNAPNIELNSDAGYFSIVEYEYAQRDSKLLLGAWQYSQSQRLVTTEDADSMRESGNFGVYLRYETALFTEHTNAFVRLGFADSSFNQFDRFAAAGISHQGLLASRPNDNIGIAIAYLHNGGSVNEFANSIDAKSHETNIEMTYQFTLNDSIALQPNVQYVLNPSAIYDDALIVGLRVSIAYELF